MIAARQLEHQPAFDRAKGERPLVGSGPYLCPRDRDAVDARIVHELRTGTGRIIDSQDEVGGYPRNPGGMAAALRTLDVPATGVQVWLQGFAAEVE